jgi:hypothetical protein
VLLLEDRRVIQRLAQISLAKLGFD